MPKRSVNLIGILCILALNSWALSATQIQKPGLPLPAGDPSSVGISAERLHQIEGVVNTAITNRQLPGAVVLVARHGRVVYRKAFGHRSLQPDPVPMTVDTVFDLASLTKVVATATSILILAERGVIRIGDRVSKYIPEFARNGKERITIEQLLTHRAGFVPDNDIADYQHGPEQAIERIYSLSPIYEPGSKFVYSDVGYIVLGELVRRVSGQREDVFAHENIFHPAGMNHTTFLPDPILIEQTAPTEQREGHWMVGEVHDPRAHLLGGIAGHAGLFSHVDDLALFGQMILNGGEINESRILSPLGIRRMTSALHLPEDEARGLGWDINTAYTANRGDFFTPGSFGHTGFTGTSMWIDPTLDTMVVFLSNRVHPDGKGDVTSLRGRVASIVAASIIEDIPGSAGEPHGMNAHTFQTLTGIDVLKRDGFKQLAGRRIGLITNHTGKDREGTSTIDLLRKAKGLELVALFTPEHGIRGEADEQVGDGEDDRTGLPIYSLYGQSRRPTQETLRGIDTLVFDIQDIGTRFYTYITTLGYAMEAAAAAGIRFIVLDRPNPITGLEAQGPMTDEDKESFTAYHPLPVRHGMTVGELARLFRAERNMRLDLDVIELEGWSRAMWFDGTGLVWINPSPNMRSLGAALLYPGIGLLETTNLSVGRGTDRPFEQVGAPWLDGQQIARALNSRGLAGVAFVPLRFTPNGSVFANQECGGISIIVTHRDRFDPIRCGIEIATVLLKLYPQHWEVEKYGKLLANAGILKGLQEGEDGEILISRWRPALAEFNRLRRKYLIYR